MGYESLRENFINIPHTVAGKIQARVFKKLTNFTNGFSPYPQVVTFYLSELCNLNCEMCFLKNIEWEPGFIPLEIAKGVIKELMPVRPNYSFSGGEPLLYPDIEKLIHFIKKRGLSLSIVTNGTLLPELAEFLVYTGTDRIKVSIDGPPDVHDRIRRKKGTFKKLERGIHKLNKYKKRMGKARPRLFLYSLLNPSMDSEFIISFAEENEFDTINFLNILSISEDEFRKAQINELLDIHYWKGAVFDSGAFHVEPEIIRDIGKEETELNIINTPDIEPDELENYYKKDNNYLRQFNGRCIAPWIAAYIKPPAKVEICPDLSIGNISRQRFLTLWNSKKARILRKKIYNGNMLPVCSGCCSFYM